MSLHLSFNPSVLDSAGVATLREAVHLAAKAAGTTTEDERQQLAGIVFSFYRRGLVDPRRLAEIAVLASSSRLFRSQYYAEAERLRPADRATTARLE
ncbi:MAG: hypothetical protein ACK4QP_07840 [Pseudorhizobium sp.]